MVTGPVLRYDEPRLVEDLARLAPVRRALFATVCAERLLPLYRWFHERTGQGDPVALEDVLVGLWADLESEGSSRLEVGRDVAEALVPDEDKSSVNESGFAQHAAAAVAYAIRCRLTGDAQEAAWAARQAYEALDLWVTSRDNVDLNAAGAEDRILADPLIQSELARQRSDLVRLRDMPNDGVLALASEMRQRAQADGPRLFGTAM